MIVSAAPSWSLRTHIPLWHASAAAVRESVETHGLKLMREYVWCDLCPHWPMHLYARFTGDYILSQVLLPIAGDDAYLWARTRGASGGDITERTFNLGGGEMMIWTDVPRPFIREIIDRPEAERRLAITNRGFYGPWLPTGDAFEAECHATAGDLAEPPMLRLLAATYLFRMQQFNVDAPSMSQWRAALVDALACTGPAALPDDGLRPCTWLLKDQPWLNDFFDLSLPRAVDEDRLGKVVAHAHDSHSAPAIEQILRNANAPETIRNFSNHWSRLLASEGRDADAVNALSRNRVAIGAAVVYSLTLCRTPRQALALALLQILDKADTDLGTPALLHLLRHWRMLHTKARSALPPILARRIPSARDGLTAFASGGLLYSRKTARRLLNLPAPADPANSPETETGGDTHQGGRGGSPILTSAERAGRQGNGTTRLGEPPLPFP